MGLILAQNEC